MLTPEYLDKLPEHVVNTLLDLEDEIIADIARRISENLQLTETAEYQIEMLYRMNYDIERIEKKIAKAMNISEKKLEELLKEAAETSYENERLIYKKGGKILPPIDNNPRIIDFIEAIIRQTSGSFRNLTNTAGFVSGNQFMKASDFYRNTLDFAVWELGTGAFDYNTVLRKAVKALGDSGIRTIDYESGRKYHIESVARMTILTGTSQITGYISEFNADMMGQDLMQITAHFDARPSHAVWQGQVVSRSGRREYLSLEDIGYGEPGGFKGVNCRHDWYPYFEGISSPLPQVSYPEPFTYKGKTYDAYQASQRQRYMERQIRKTKRQIIAYENAGQKEDAIDVQIKLSRQRQEYERFSSKAGLRAKLERTHTYGYGRSQSMRAVWAMRKAH